MGLRKEEGKHSGMGRPWWWAMRTDLKDVLPKIDSVDDVSKILNTV